MRKTLYLNNDWKFSDVFEDKMIAPDYDDNHLESIRIPHSVVTTPFN